MIFLQTEVHKNTESIWLAATIYQSSAESCWTTNRAWCFPWAPECWAAATLETKSKQTTGYQDQQSDSLWHETLDQPWKWSKIKFQLSSPLHSPHYTQHDWKNSNTKAETEKCTIYACCSRVLFVIDKPTLMYCWFSDTVVARLWLNFNRTVGAYFKVFPYSLLLCTCWCYDSPVLRPAWKV